MSRKKQTQEGVQLGAGQVADYLRRHPDFFLEHTELLASLRIKSPRDDKVVPLIDKQAEVLRERNQEMRQRMSEALAAARSNEQLFDKTRRLVLDLIETQTLDDVIVVLRDSLRHDFNADTNSLILFGEVDYDSRARMVPVREAQQNIPGILKTNQPTCGILRDEELEFLFPANHEVGSAVAAPLVHGGPIGVLAIGSYDPEYYRSGMGTIFISYVVEALCRIVPRYFHPELPFE